MVTFNGRLSLSELKGRLLDRGDALVQHLLPGCRRDSRGWRTGDLGGSQGSSLSVVLRGPRAGSFKDFATDERGDLLDLIAMTLGISIGEAIQWAREWLGDYIDTPPPLHPHSASDAEERTTRRERALNKFWRPAQPLAGTQGERYLVECRGIALSAWPSSLRFLNAAFYPRLQRCFPAIVALVQDASGVAIGAHVIYLDSGGAPTKAKLPNGLKSKLSHGPVGGGAVRVAEGDDRLIVTEGIEDALTAAIALKGASAWAAIGSGIRGVRLPGCVSRILIVADNDARGLEAAERLKQRLIQEGRVVGLFVPPDGVKDLNDLLQKLSEAQG